MELDLKVEHEDLIKGRIRHLEAVIFRARQRQRQRQRHGYTRIQITNFAGEVLTKGDNVQDENVGVDDVEKGTVECEKMCKRKASDLVAKALCKSFYDCNICFNKARDPVLTCCGHLLCWSCFYQLSYAVANANAKECPVCLGEIFETDLIPVYGNASVDGSDRLELKESGSTIPPRPSAARIESNRQQRRSTSIIPDVLMFGEFLGIEEPHGLEIPSISTDGSGTMF